MDPIIEINGTLVFLSGWNPRIGKHPSAGDAGEKIALVGANGAGKSTLLLHLNGIFSGSGKIKVDGLEMNKRITRRSGAW